MSTRKLHWLYELDDVPRDRYVKCEVHDYWHRESQGCCMCRLDEEARARSP